ncbi:hypothetical protein BDA99DRAFT_539203 [Phascolomyces articulosus]|uniref:Uncharacterized protein n=1 Tax=Phascolomyces articulosus TaxID=60185 RepID=A0AAD5JX97_9FUNG|nr:hypothetical protein BDA99DRAFT_539203 [Phascolomyces articulosus]
MTTFQFEQRTVFVIKGFAIKETCNDRTLTKGTKGLATKELVTKGQFYERISAIGSRYIYFFRKQYDHKCSCTRHRPDDFTSHQVDALCMNIYGHTVSERMRCTRVRSHSRKEKREKKKMLLVVLEERNLKVVPGWLYLVHSMTKPTTVSPRHKQGSVLVSVEHSIVK